MNEYQQALMRIIELEDKNAELLEALVAIVDRCCLNDRFPDLTGPAYEIIRKNKGELTCILSN